MKHKFRIKIACIILSIAIIVGLTPTFAFAVNNNDPIPDGFTFHQVVLEHSVKLSDDTYRTDISDYNVAIVKQSTFLVVWTMKQLSEESQNELLDGLFKYDKAQSLGIPKDETTKICFFYGLNNHCPKPDWAGNSFGEYWVEDNNGTLNMYAKGISHFVVGLWDKIEHPPGHEDPPPGNGDDNPPGNGGDNPPTVDNPPVINNNPPSVPVATSKPAPKTSDNSNIALWMLLTVLSGASLISTRLITRKLNRTE
ncbi:MAG: hypothetical protein K0R18_2138 [Bacillales bacterium]|jgi:hypothetical protein|nr:hypothetical protein [Bacillales bacterium]